MPGGQVVVEIGGASGLAEAADGAVADRLGDAFAEARDAMLALEPGGAVLLKYTTGWDGTVLSGAIASLCRTLAREGAPSGVRVNAILADPDADIERLVAFLGSEASTMCTGAVLEAVR